MMKRVMFVVVSLLIVGTCFAQLQSGPSNVVGYVKVDINSGTQPAPTYKEFGLPFKFWDVPGSNIPTYGTESRKPSDIVGTQANQGSLLAADRISRQDNATYAYRNTAGTWAGALETSTINMDPGRAYWYVNKSGVARTLVLAGQVDNSGAGVPTDTIKAPTPPSTAYFASISWRDSRDLARAELGLRTQGFTGGSNSLNSDRLAAQTGGTFAWYRTSDGSWQGTLTLVNPGKSYWIKNVHTTTWYYNFNLIGSPITEPDNGTRDLQIITAPATKQAVKARVSSN